MVKNIEWLKIEVERLHKNVEVCTSDNYLWGMGYSEAIRDCETLVGCLLAETPKPVTVPYFIEHYLDKAMAYSVNEKVAFLLSSYNGDEFTICDTMVKEGDLTEGEAYEIVSWAQLQDVSLLINIAKYGYVNDLYYINFGGELGYAQRFDEKRIDSQLVHKEIGAKFSESEIKALNNGHLFWNNFAEKV